MQTASGAFAALISQTDDGLTREEADALRGALWRLLMRRARYITMGDSDSMPVERLEALMTSVSYALLSHMEACRLPKRALLGDLDALYNDAILTLERKLDAARALHREACDFAPPVMSLSWRDTLQSIGEGFNRYDCRAFAQDMPCSIDYQLCLPAPDALMGVDGAIEYLRRFLCEIALMKRLEAPLMARLMRRALADPEGLLVNLYEPLMANAVGATLANLPVAALDVPPDALARLCDALRDDDMGALRLRLLDASEHALDALAIRESATRQYFAEAALSLAPRVLAALPSGGLRHIFVSL